MEENLFKIIFNSLVHRTKQTNLIKASESNKIKWKCSLLYIKPLCVSHASCIVLSSDNHLLTIIFDESNLFLNSWGISTTCVDHQNGAILELEDRGKAFVVR